VSENPPPPPSPYGSGQGQQPQQPPQGQPPQGPPPQGPPPGFSPYPYQPQKPPGMSNRARFWIGVALAIPVLVLAGTVNGIAGAIGSAVDPNTGSMTGVLVVIVDLLMFVGLVVAIVMPRTRYFALGVLAGVAILFVLLAGACVLLLAGLSGGFS
jgi:hypothetical protein